MRQHWFVISLLLFNVVACLPLMSHTVAADPGLIIVSNPSNGIWYTEDQMYVSWTSSNAGSSVDIELYLGGTRQTTIFSGHSNYQSNTYYWNIPAGIPTSSSYRIKITSTENQTIYGFSSYFTINERVITILSPSGGETWYEDETYAITWSSQNIYGYVSLSAFLGGSTYSISSYIDSSQGIYQWIVPDSIPSGSCRIRIIAMNYPTVTDESNAFTIKKRTLLLTSPQNHAVWYKGETYPINWTSDAAGSMVNLDLYKKEPNDHYFYQTIAIATRTDNDGSYSWIVPQSLSPTATYKIYISSTTYPNTYNYSGVFSSEERYIRVMVPASVNSWFLGNVYNISWESHNAGDTVTIELNQGGELKSIIAANISNAGSFLWVVPKDFPVSTKSQIKIKSISIPTLYGMSSLFSLEKKSVNVTITSDDEPWYNGGAYKITWESKGFSSAVKIELLSENTYVLMIASNVKNNGSYTWTIPTNLAPGSTYQLKITSVSDDSLYGISPGYLTVENTFLQQWSGTILLFAGICVVFIFVYIFIIRRWRRKITLESAQRELPAVFVPEVLSEEEYENIWEKNRD